MRVETERMYLYPLSDEEMRMVMRLLVDHGLRVMDITKAVSLRLRIIKLRSQYNLKMQAFERTKIWLQAKFCGVTSNWAKANKRKEWKYVFIPSKEVRANSSFGSLTERFMK